MLSDNRLLRYHHVQLSIVKVYDTQRTATTSHPQPTASAARFTHAACGEQAADSTAQLQPLQRVSGLHCTHHSPGLQSTL
jgi:hypothetical protein